MREEKESRSLDSEGVRESSGSGLGLSDGVRGEVQRNLRRVRFEREDEGFGLRRNEEVAMATEECLHARGF